MSEPPVMLISRPRAPVMLVSSSSGLLIAASAARIARSSPSASPVPIIALPISRHHGADIGKVQIDHAGQHHQVGHAAHAHVQHVIGHLERFFPAGALIRDLEQVLVRDHDQRIDIFLQFGDALFGRAHALLALEGERLGDDADGEDVALARHAGDHRRRTGAGAAAHAGGDEHHVRVFEMPVQFIRRFFRRGLADFRPRRRRHCPA